MFFFPEKMSHCALHNCTDVDFAVPVLLEQQMIPERMPLHKHACNCMTKFSHVLVGPFEAIRTKQVVIKEWGSNVCTLGRADLHVTDEFVDPAGEYIKHHLQ